MTFHNDSIDKVLKHLSSDPDSGLSPSRADETLKIYGKNRLKEKKKKSNLIRFLAP